MKTCIKCGSHAFNLYAEGIDQGGFCDVHYWQGRAHRAEAQPEQEQKCWCTTCRPITMSDMRFVVCPDCGNKRCPKANDHCNACTESNEVGQKGSSWEHVKPLAQPEQEPVAWNKQIRDRVDSLLKQAGYQPDSSSRNALAMMNFDTPPQRPWVGLGLTVVEIMREWHSANDSVVDFARVIEAKLKELNT